jgi:uncharacterized membrane protein
MNNVTEPRPGLDWRWLALSLVCNLFLAAVIAGHFMSSRVRPVRVAIAATPMARALARAAAVLPPKDAASFRAVIEREKPQYAQAAKEVGEARAALERDIAADPFDPKAASQALAAWRVSWDRFVEDFSGPMMDALATLSPEGRRSLVAQRRERREQRQDDPDSR